MLQTKQAIHLAGKELDGPRHVCAFFRNEDERYTVLMPFIREGFEQGQRAFHIIDPSAREQHMLKLKEGGLEPTALEANGQLEIRGWDDAYLRGGRFNQDAMLALIEEVLLTGKRSFPLTRLVAQMEWAVEDRPGVHDIAEYEARLNYILPNYEDPVVCTYDLAKFGAGVVLDILRTHQMVILGGILQENPFYLPPDEFIKELRRR